MIKVIYEGSDITDRLSINRCYHDMYGSDRCDSMSLRLLDPDSLLDDWAPQPGDSIAVEYGAARTGKMYVSQLIPENGLYTIEARSAPQSMFERTSRAWQKVRFLQMGQDIASRHGLKFESYGVDDQLYDYILQDNEADFSFLRRRCALESCASIIFDDTVIVYSVPAMERQKPEKSTQIGRDVDFRFLDLRQRLYGSCNLERGDYAGTFDAHNGSTAVLIPDASVTAGSSAEAARFARGLLREANQLCASGFWRSGIMPGSAPASMVDLKNVRARSWDGPVFITHVRNYYNDGTSKIWFRRPLEGY